MGWGVTSSVALLSSRVEKPKPRHDFCSFHRGSLNTSVIRTAEVFRDAVKENCASIIVVHNHPSGDPTPSPEDVRVTRDLVAAGTLLDIEVLDHLVIGRNRYVSLRQKKLGFD